MVAQTSGRVVLHVGAMKTGTSYLQSLLGHNQDALAEAGFDFLGGRFGVQARAVRDVLALPKEPRRNQRGWARIAKEARQLDGRTGLVSMEFLSFAKPRHVAAFLEPLEGLDVEVVMTVRDQLRTVPAQWQTYTRNFGTEDWGTYLRAIEGGRRAKDSRGHMTFHRAQDILPALERWASAPQVRRVHVLTVPADPDAPRDELWHRFRAATGIPEVPVDVAELRDNASLGFGSCDLLRRMNPHLADVRPARYRNGIVTLAREVLAPRRPEESRPRLDRRAAKWARARNEELRAQLGRYELHGTLDDLPVPDDLGDHPRRVPAEAPEEAVAAGRAVWAHLAGQAGAGDRPPSDPDALAEGTARLLRTVRGWD